jgi:cytochrome d ubiquinol oxidase subunit II
MEYLAYGWAGIIAFCVLMYVVLDGFTLGAGMMMAFLDDKERSIAMSVLLPTWDGNQTWLVLGMASLYGAFPAAFSLLLPMLYLPLMLMVLCLLLRGVVFEFRLKSTDGVARWDFIFIVTCVLVTLIQGSILANMIEGFDGHGFQMDGFTVLVSIVVLVGYALLGATRLLLKTTQRLQLKMYRVTLVLSSILLPALVAVSIASLFVHPNISGFWLNKAYWSELFIFPSLSLLAFLFLFLSIKRRWEAVPYWSMVIIFICCYAGFSLDVFPYIVPHQLTILAAAAPKSTLQFIMVGAVIMLPVLLVYTGYAYYIFKGKVNDVIHY